MTSLRILFAIAVFALALPCVASDGDGRLDTLPPNRFVTSASSLAVGHTNQLNTYLSPLEYTGLQLTFLQESMRPTRHFGYRLAVQTEWRAAGAYTESPTGDGKEWYLDAGWTGRWLYSFAPAKGLTLLAGVGVEGSVGGTYNTRNGNNPAQLNLSATLPLSGMAVYRFRMMRKDFTARYQMSMPLVGVMFSPVYNESYYEIFIVDTPRDNFRMIWPGNAPSFRQILTLDFDLWRTGTLRLGFMSDVRQSHVNEIKAHVWTNSFVIGYVKHFIRAKRGDGGRKHFIY